MVEIEQAFSDTGRLIVQTAVLKSLKNYKVRIIGEDVDLIVLLVALPLSERLILFVEPNHAKP